MKPESNANREKHWRKAGLRILRGRASRALQAVLGLALLVALSCSPAGRSQSPGGYPIGPGGNRPYAPGRQGSGVDEPGDFDPVMAERRVRALNVERQKQLVSDAAKLLKLARELHEEVSSTNPDAFSPDQIRKIAEIEKLARSVKDRMATGVGQPGNIMQAPLVYPVH